MHIGTVCRQNDTTAHSFLVACVTYKEHRPGSATLLPTYTAKGRGNRGRAGQGREGYLTSVSRSSGAALGSETPAVLSRLGVLDEGSQESSDPTEPCAATSKYCSYNKHLCSPHALHPPRQLLRHHALSMTLADIDITSMTITQKGASKVTECV